ncbi:hypothetical protein PHYSODRAFT_247388 [Phytophthora sojae]|uniref:BED-type domain-containing protein n=1 Tax=Phytophthora sojae (strain P6497) TaxID=1094619 RepID=G4Z5I0_PHYSP|nr:hypothetical protein PHYSODRAFT_247388 [Phytophthora sojae]EGZ21658.1 hypothetical protein PHYSODRAFT_247388 [Phytophthora sojae]|eukprot:XP_009524375.1 hypothetical protein PHYSODRAFT_247388 [Phytophthora sojae]
MARGLNKEWDLFGARYRVAGAKVDKVDCNACNKQVSAAVNRLQSHMRICPARASVASTLQTTTTTSTTNGSSTAPPADSLSAAIEQAIETGALAAEHTAPTAAEGGAPPLKKQRQSPARTHRPRSWNAAASNGSASANAAASLNVDDFWVNPAVGVPATAASPSQQSASSSLTNRRLDIEEKRLALEVKREQREQAREQLNLEILAAQAKREKLLAEKEGYEAKVLLALSRKQLRDQGVSEDEIDRVLPVSGTSSSSSSSGGGNNHSNSNSNSATTDATTGESTNSVR